MAMTNKIVIQYLFRDWPCRITETVLGRKATCLHCGSELYLNAELRFRDAVMEAIMDHVNKKHLLNTGRDVSTVMPVPIQFDRNTNLH
jgi:hypothetical protein